jgi:hypothetical protein
VVRGSVRPRKRRALLIVDRKESDNRWRRIAAQTVLVRGGRMVASRRFGRRGTYRLRLGVNRDGVNLSARSEPIVVTVL